jgi:hypothetical protein
MAYSQDKGNEAARSVADYLSVLGPCYRPRTTSLSQADVGDIVGLPFVVSVKNHNSINLSSFVDELSRMVARSHHDTGVVFMKRRGFRHPDDWYVLTTGKLAVPLLHLVVQTDRFGPPGGDR